MRLLLALLVGATVPTALSAQAADTTIKQERPGLLARAKITPDSARAIALRTIPGATIQSSEIENEDQRLIYSFDMKVPGKPGIEEVNINALTGTVVGREHESDRSERAEAPRAAPRPQPRPRPAPTPAPAPAPAPAPRP